MGYAFKLNRKRKHLFIMFKLIIKFTSF